jgi:hypothetical protein
MNHFMFAVYNGGKSRLLMAIVAHPWIYSALVLVGESEGLDLQEWGAPRCRLR